MDARRCTRMAACGSQRTSATCSWACSGSPPSRCSSGGGRTFRTRPPWPSAISSSCCSSRRPRGCGSPSSTSFAAMLAFNFFFLPPVGTLTIADPQNWIALFAFLAVSLVASNLSAVARARTQEAEARRDELGRLFDLSRDILLITDSQEANALARRLHLAPLRSGLRRRSACRKGAEWLRASRRDRWTCTLDPRAAVGAFAASVDDRSSTDAGPPAAAIRAAAARRRGRSVCWPPPAARSRPATLDAVAGLAAIAIERAQFLDERKARRTGAAERGAEVGAAGLARPRSADAADRDPRRRRATCRRRGPTNRSGGSRAT